MCCISSGTGRLYLSESLILSYPLEMFGFYHASNSPFHHPFTYACRLGDQQLHPVTSAYKYVMSVSNRSKPFIIRIMCPRNFNFLILILCLSLIYLSFPFYVESRSVHGMLCSLLQKSNDFAPSLLFFGEEFIQYSLLWRRNSIVKIFSAMFSIPNAFI